MPHWEDRSFPIIIIKRRISQSNSRRIRPREQLDSQSIVPCKINIQSLPEDIALKITSKLTVKEAAQMSVLSSLWRQACIFHHNLHFDVETVLGSDEAHCREGIRPNDPSKTMLTANKFVQRVDAVLKNHCGKQVNRFAVNFCLTREHASHINRWVSFAIASKARVVVLSFTPNRIPFGPNNFEFPFQLLDGQNGSCIQALQLGAVTWAPTPDFHGFANLKMLALDFVIIALRDLKHLLSNCCALEWLSIRRCFKLQPLRVQEPLCRLQYLCVEDCVLRNIELHAPHLTTFEYRGSPISVKFNESLKLKTVTVIRELSHFDETLDYVLTIIPSMLPHVDTLCVKLFIRNQVSGFTKSPSKFSHLRQLTMEIRFWGDKYGTNAVLQLAYLLEVAPFLEDLHLEMFGLSSLSCPLDLEEIADLPHNHLKSVYISGFCGNPGQVELGKYILKNALVLERFIIRPGANLEGVPTVGVRVGLREAKEKLVPLDIHDVLTIL